MFKNKKKIDSRVRWQSQKFKNRLQEARGYKRPARSVPDSPLQIFLAKIGLGSWVSKILTLSVFFFLVYIVYIPNVFFIKQVTINGTDQAAQASARVSVNSFLDKKLPFPEKNLLFFSKNGLKTFLLKNNQKILSVNSINRKLPSTLILNITPRLDEFILESSSTDYSLSNDGLVTGIIEPDASGTLPSGLVLIKLNNDSSYLTPGQSSLAYTVKFINGVQNGLPSIVNSGVGHYELTDLQTPDLSVYLQNGVKIMFDLNSDLAKTLSRLQLLFSQFSPADIKNLYYVDMRFEDQAYVCNKGAPCVNSITLPNNTATGTPDNLPN